LVDRVCAQSEAQVQANSPKDAATLDPSGAYATPRHLCEDRTLPIERRIALLRQWEYDLRSIQIAVEENMASATVASSGKSAELLSEVRRCLRALGDDSGDHSPTTKQGGGGVERGKLP
jgi:hypothetical protein